MSLTTWDIEEMYTALYANIPNSASRLYITNAYEVQLPPYCSECTTIDFTFSAYSVPAADTTYTCMGFEFPVDAKQHIIRFDPLLQASYLLCKLVLNGRLSRVGGVNCASSYGNNY